MSALGGVDAGTPTKREKTLVVLVRHADAPASALTPAQVEAYLATVSDRFVEFSYGRVGLSGLLNPAKGADVMGWYSTTSTSCLDEPAFLALSGQDLSQYGRIVLVVNQRAGCTGLAARALGNRVTMTVANVGVGILTHELGHTFGAAGRIGYAHANFWDCGSAALAATGCHSVEYGDPYDVMGVGGGGHFSAGFKDGVGWFAGTTALKQVTSSGDFVLEPFETNTNGFKALKVPRGDGTSLYVEYRQPLGVDAVLQGTSVFDGALFHLDNALINTSPPALTYTGIPTDAQLTPVLHQGETFTAPGVGRFTVLSRTPQALTVRVALDPPTVDLKVNGLDGPVTLDAPASISPCFTTVGVGVTCVASGDWTGSWTAGQCVSGLTFPTIGVRTLTLTCSNAQGSTTDTVKVSVQNPTTAPTVAVTSWAPMGPASGTVTHIAPASFPVSWTSARASGGCTNTGAWTGTVVANSFSANVMALPVGTYVYGVTCKNDVGTASDQLVVQVVPRPVVSVSAPAPGAILSGSAPVQFSVDNPSLLNWVSISIDGVGVGLVMKNALQWSLDTTRLTDGAHTLSTQVQDSEWNMYPGPSLSFIVSNVDLTPPTVSLATLPSKVGGQVTLTATATDDLRVAGVQFLLDGAPIGTEVLTPPYVLTWNSASVVDGVHTLGARARDGVGRLGFAPVQSVITDRTAPALSAVSVSPSPFGATITWSTNEPATSQVEYGLAAALGSSTPLVAALTTAHGVTLSGLKPGTPYFYRLRSLDGVANLGLSAVLQFTTSPIPTVTATYDATVKTSRCTTTKARCESGTTFSGRAGLGPELNTPNTIGATCADGKSGTFHVDESVDWMSISTLDGTPLAAGKTVRIEVRVWAYSDFTTDHLDLYAAANGLSPSWTYLTTLTPAASGSQVLSTTWVLPAGGVQAVRANFRYLGAAGPCTSGAFDDRDDLVFSVL